MQHRNIGSLEVSVVGLGCNNFGRRLDASRTVDVVHAALDAGVNFFDSADLYGDGASEEYLGRALRNRRTEAVIATKFGHQRSSFGKGARPEHVRDALEGSLKRLGTDYVDLYQIHQPDPDTPIADTLAALDDAVRAGKVRAIGCSNFSVAQLREAEAAAKPNAARFVSVQNEYSLFERAPEQGVLAECEREGIAFLPYFPLASGLLTGKVSPAPASPARPPVRTRWLRRVADRRESRDRRAADHFRGKQGAHPARARDLMAARTRGGGVGHRGCDEAGSGPLQCERGRVAVVERRAL